MELPRNITQIGESDRNCKIYVEDYVISYIKQINQLAVNKVATVALYGERKEEGGISYLFFYGACKVECLQKEVRHLSQAQMQEIEKLRKKYFSDYQFLGYRLLNGEMVEGFQIYEQGICRYISGYACFYEKNESMLAYMLDTRQDEIKPEVFDQEKYNQVKLRQEERKARHNETEKNRPGSRLAEFMGKGKPEGVAESSRPELTATENSQDSQERESKIQEFRGKRASSGRGAFGKKGKSFGRETISGRGITTGKETAAGRETVFGKEETAGRGTISGSAAGTGREAAFGRAADTGRETAATGRETAFGKTADTGRETATTVREAAFGKEMPLRRGGASGREAFPGRRVPAERGMFSGRESYRRREELPPSRFAARSMHIIRVSVVVAFALLCVVGLSTLNGFSSLDDIRIATSQFLSELTEQKIPDADDAIEVMSPNADADTLVAEDKLADAIWKENRDHIYKKENDNNWNEDRKSQDPISQDPINAVAKDPSFVEGGAGVPVEGDNGLGTPNIPLSENVASLSEQPVDQPLEQSVAQPLDQPAGPSAEQAPEIPAPVSYTIQKGDTLIGISLRVYGTGSRVRDICDLNNIANPDNIQYGQKILLP
jgi:LysM repeat protein